MRALKCSHCHEKVHYEWKFCPHCGWTLVDEKVVYWFYKALKTKKIAYAILVFEIIFIALAAYFMVDMAKKLQQKDQAMDQILKYKKVISFDEAKQDDGGQ